MSGPATGSCGCRKRNLYAANRTLTSIARSPSLAPCAGEKAAPCWPYTELEGVRRHQRRLRTSELAMRVQVDRTFVGRQGLEAASASPPAMRLVPAVPLRPASIMIRTRTAEGQVVPGCKPPTSRSLRLTLKVRSVPSENNTKSKARQWEGPGTNPRVGHSRRVQTPDPSDPLGPRELSVRLRAGYHTRHNGWHSACSSDRSRPNRNRHGTPPDHAPPACSSRRNCTPTFRCSVSGRHRSE